MIVLGIHCGFSIHTHEPGAAIVKNGNLIAACEEERYVRNKNAIGFLPNNSINEVIKISKTNIRKINLVVSTGITVKNYKKTLQKYFLENFGFVPNIRIVHHHLSHLAAAFYSSGFKKSACLSLDAFGDKASGMIAEADIKKGIKIKKIIESNNSLGNFYSAVTEFLGYSDGDEYKVMGLAPYGKPKVKFNKIIKFNKDFWKTDNTFFRNQKTPFDHRYSKKFIKNFKKYRRLSGEKILQKHKDFAASAQKVTDLVIKKSFSYVKKKSTYKDNICFSGGTALNCSSAKEVLYSKMFKKIYIPVNPSDRGLATGCAFLGSVFLKDVPKKISSAYLGSSYSVKAIKKELINNNINFIKEKDISKKTAYLLSKGKIVAWYNGRSEIGARALGNRSILADPRKKNMKNILNKKIKYREEFRPFAPAILEEYASKYFITNGQSVPFMNFTLNVRKKFSKYIRSAVHVDGTSRVQTVSKINNPSFYNLIKDFYKITGVPVLINTSFNLKGQPIVETPRDALMTFFGSGIDYLVLGPFLISKN